jgi:hypothetical protein
VKAEFDNLSSHFFHTSFDISSSFSCTIENKKITFFILQQPVPLLLAAHLQTRIAFNPSDSLITFDSALRINLI